MSIYCWVLKMILLLRERERVLGVVLICFVVCCLLVLYRERERGKVL